MWRAWVVLFNREVEKYTDRSKEINVANDTSKLINNISIQLKCYAILDELKNLKMPTSILSIEFRLTFGMGGGVPFEDKPMYFDVEPIRPCIHLTLSIKVRIINERTSSVFPRILFHDWIRRDSISNIKWDVCYLSVFSSPAFLISKLSPAYTTATGEQLKVVPQQSHTTSSLPNVQPLILVISFSLLHISSSSSSSTIYNHSNKPGNS